MWMVGGGLRLHGIQCPSKQCADTVRGRQRARVNELLNDYGIAGARGMGGHRLPADALFAHEPYFLAPSPVIWFADHVAIEVRKVRLLIFCQQHPFRHGNTRPGQRLAFLGLAQRVSAEHAAGLRWIMTDRCRRECQRGPLRKNETACITIPDGASVNGWIKLTDQMSHPLKALPLEIFVDEDDQIAFPLSEEF